MPPHISLKWCRGILSMPFQAYKLQPRCCWPLHMSQAAQLNASSSAAANHTWDLSCGGILSMPLLPITHEFQAGAVAYRPCRKAVLTLMCRMAAGLPPLQGHTAGHGAGREVYGNTDWTGQACLRAQRVRAHPTIKQAYLTTATQS